MMNQSPLYFSSTSIFFFSPSYFCRATQDKVNRASLLDPFNFAIF